MFNAVLPATFSSPIRLQRYGRGILAFWTFAIAVVLLLELSDEHQQAMKIARGEAAGAWKREAAFYRWAANMGGVFVPTNDTIKPDDKLSGDIDREATTTAGRKLTLLSAPTILEQLHTIAFGQSSVQGHLTSLNPIRATNGPDPWEKQSLEAFNHGSEEAYTVESVDGKRYMRLMRPLRTEASCLACHVEQGYKVGEIRGGLSIAVPMQLVQNAETTGIIHCLANYGGLWLVGVLGITLLSQRLSSQMTHRYEAERRLQEAHDLLERRVEERTTELAAANDNLKNEIADRKQAEQWLLESEQRFRSYFEQGLVGMAILTAEGDWIEVNHRLCRMLGYAEEELLLKNWLSLIHPERQAAGKMQFQQVLDGTVRNISKETMLVRKDGVALTVSVSAQCLKRPDGTIDCILVLVQDMHHHPAA